MFTLECIVVRSIDLFRSNPSPVIYLIWSLEHLCDCNKHAACLLSRQLDKSHNTLKYKNVESQIKYYEEINDND